MAKNTLHIADLTQGPRNARKHNERNLDMIATSLADVGAARSIVIDEDNTILAGNGTVQAAEKAGITNVRIVEANGDEIIAVKRTNLTPEQKRKLSLYDNRSAELAEWDTEMLEELGKEIDLSGFWDDAEFTALSAGSKNETVPESVETPLSEIKAEAITKKGDLYEFECNGMTSRLLCGDSTNAADVALLMGGKKAALLFTDPPYNISYAEFNTKGRGKDAKDWTDVYCSDWKDEMPDDDYATFLNAILRNAKASLIDDAHYYVWYAAKYYDMVTAAFKNSDVHYDAIPLIWVKQTFTMSWAHYHRQYEPCIVGGKGMPTTTKRWFGANNETNVWDVPTEHNSTYIHPTQKPIALIQRALLNSSQSGELVLDLFAGSGSTLLASLQNGRYCNTIEQEVSFCDAIVRRVIAYSKSTNTPITIKRNGEVLKTEEFQCAA